MRKIFITDSDPIFRAKLGSYLDRMEGAEVFTFFSGEDCLRFIDAEPDILIVDYHLESRLNPVLSGFDLLKVVTREHPTVKVIMISSHNDHNEDMNSATCGAFDYIPKTEDNIYRIENTVLNAFKYNSLEDNIKLYRNTLYLILGFGFTMLSGAGAFLMNRALHSGNFSVV